MELELMDFLEKILTFFVLFNILALGLRYFQVTHPSMGLNIYQNLRNKGYNVEEHIIQTEDGYLLTVQRIPCDKNKKSCSTNLPPVLIMHGMSSLADDWVCHSANKSLALLLAERGFDVWLGNNRGNTWSRSHIKLDPEKDAEFWNYSYNEMGIFDLPAIIDYILKETDKKKLTYVGYSQGFTQLLVLGSKRPEYNEKILMACGVAPVTNMYNITNPVIQIIGKFDTTFDWLTETFNVHKILERQTILTDLIHNIIFSHPVVYDLLATRFISKYLMGSSSNVDKLDTKYCFSNWPAGISVNQLKHYIQGYKTGKFSQFDYGSETNMKLYNATSPPAYDLRKVSMPMAIFYSRFDKFVNNEDMQKTLSKVPNIVERHLVTSVDFDHIDFLHSDNVTDLAYNPIIKIIEKYHSKEH